MSTAFNIWKPQGHIIANPGGTVLGNPSVIPGINGVVLSGTVFGAFAGYDENGAVYYFESADGLTSWTPYGSNPITLSGAAYFPTVYEFSGTYYLYACLTGFPGTGIGVYTSSSPIGPWTAQGGIQIPLGSAGAWDSTGVFQLNVLTQLNGTWYAYYSGYNGTQFGQGLVTSTDLIHWTKSVSNPIFPGPIGNMCFLTVGNVYYAYAAFPNPNATMKALGNDYLGRWSATAPSGPWTSLEYNNVQVPTYYISSPAELNNGTSLPASNANDQRLVVANGNIYMYYTYTLTGGNEQGVYAALASGITPAQLISSYEGVFNIPFPIVPQLNLVTLGADTFNRANVNPLGGNWSPVVSGKTSQIVSDIVNTSALGEGDSYWNATSWAADQWSESTINNITSGSFAGTTVRSSTAGANTGYRIVAQGLGASTSVSIQLLVTGTTTNLATLSFTLSSGDTLLFVVIGTNVLLYWNTFLIANYSNAVISSGAAGFELSSGTSTANAGISAWSGGSFQAAPAITFSISGNAGAAGATVSYSGTSSGSVTADGSGNYTVSGLPPGTYTITPSLAGYTFVPINLSETSAGSNITGANFIATSSSSNYSVPDARNYGNFPNLAVNVNGTLTYTVPSSYSLRYWFDTMFNRTQPLPEDSRTAGAPVACGTYPQNSRTPGTYGPGE